MTLRPPFFRFVLALVGACLVVWGAKGVVLNIPGLQEISLFEVSRAATWTLISSSVLVVVLVGVRATLRLTSPLLHWVKTPSVTWLAWTVALGALCFMAWSRGYEFYRMIQQYDEAKSLGLSLPDPRDFLRKSEVKPGLIGVIAGLVIQFVGVCLPGRSVLAGSSSASRLPRGEAICLNLPTIVASLMMCAAIFLPWVFVFDAESELEVGVPGMELGKMGAEGQWVWFLFAAGALATVLNLVRPVRVLNVIVGLLPLAALAWFTVKNGGGLFKTLGSGVWVELACGFLLVFTATFRRDSGEAPSRPATSAGVER